jgi:hypothetical protein
MADTAASSAITQIDTSFALSLGISLKIKEIGDESKFQSIIRISEIT